MAQAGQDWRHDSAFADLSESWVENNGPINALPVLQERDNNIPIDDNLDRRRSSNSRRGSSSGSSSASGSGKGKSSNGPAESVTMDGKVTIMHNNEVGLAPIHVKKRGDTRSRKHTGSVSDSELLQPGPSRPSQSKPSHHRSSSEDLQHVQGASDVENVQMDDSGEVVEINLRSPLLSSESRFSTGSGEKGGSHDEAQEQMEEPEGEEDRYNSAREDQSMSQAMTTAAEITCIEHSNIDSSLDLANAAWKQADKGKLASNILQRPPSKLRSMFQALEDVQPAEGIEGEREQGEQAEVEREEEDVAEIEGDEEADAGKEMDQTPEESPIAIIHAEAEDEEKGWVDVEPRKSISSEQEERETETMLGQVPQCVFTFSSPSPVLQQAQLMPPATPSASRGLLRLFPKGAPNAEIEQILNTPRSERKVGQARKLVSRLMEQERGERVEKRLRVDRSLPEEQILAVPQFEGYVEGGHLNVVTEQPLRDYIRDAPAFMEQLRNIRLPNDSSKGAYLSSLIANRRGAKAPTPETSLLRGRPARPLAKGQSPRKILRLFSAAHQVDEEIEEENRQAEAGEAESEWQDIVETPAEEFLLSAGKSNDSSIPIVSVDPPTQRGLESILNGAKQTGLPGMLHISPEDVDSRDLEDMANGRMTFDKAMSKWIPAREVKSSESRIESDEASDPFRDIESFASQSSIAKKGYGHAPKSQSALRHEVQMSDTSASTLHLSQAQRTLQQSPPESNNLLSAPKTPNAPLSLGRRGSTPRSILKTAARSILTPDGYSSIAVRQEPRSISFADHGPPASKQRVEKVEELLRQLAELALGPDDTIDSIAPRQDTPTRKINFHPAESMGARSPWNLSTLKGRAGAGDDVGNASFLTNASFNVAHDRILELITDVAPWEPGWLDLKHIDLSKRRVDNLVRLKDFLPNLEEAILDDNEISYLTGLPSSLRLLSLSSNRLPPTISFGHLINLEFLDISGNHVDDALMSLSPLVHLRHLRVESNRVTSLEGIEHLTKLETLNVRQNNLQVVNIAPHQWPRLKDLVLSHNKIVTVRGISHLKHLRCLNLDHNCLSRIDLGVRMSRLKQLRLSGNVDLASLDVGPAVNLRTLYADDCSLEEVLNLDRLEKLDNLSLRQQNGDGKGINWPAHQTRDIKRLFLSGNAFKSIDLSNRPTLGAPSMTKFYSMVYLELSACQLSSLPLDLADLVPNVRHLNADYNLFETLPILSSLQRLKRFSIIGCRIGKSRRVVESLNGCDELAVLDVRMNPCTMGLYPPLLLAAPKQGNRLNKSFLPPMPNPAISRPDLHYQPAVRDEEEYLLQDKSFFHKKRPSPDTSFESRSHEGESGTSSQSNNALFVTSDNRFFKTLPSQYRLQRLLHRGALAMACPNLTWLDGLLIDEEEVQQADEYFQRSLQGGKPRHRATSSSNNSESTGDTF